MKLAKFDIDKAKNGAHVFTAQGVELVDLHFLGGNIVAGLLNGDHPILCYADGSLYARPGRPYLYIGEPGPTTFWINFNEDGGDVAYCYPTREEADIHPTASFRLYGRAIPVVVEEE